MGDVVGRSFVLPELRGWAAGVDTMIVDTPRTQVHPPDLGTSLVWVRQLGTDGRTVVVRPRGEAAYAAGKTDLRAVRLRLRPGAGTLLDELRADLPQRIPMVDLGHTAQILQARVVDLLARRSARDLSRARSAVEAVAALETAGPHRHGVVEVARQLAISRRQLQRIVGEQTGIGPKQVVRIGRIRQVLAEIDRGGRDWTGQALRAGYYDQSHLISEFGTFMKVTPQAFVQRRLPTPTSC